MSSLFQVTRRSAEPIDHEIPQTLLGVDKISRRIHGTKDVVLRYPAVKGRDQFRNSGFTDQVVYVYFLQSSCRQGVIVSNRSENLQNSLNALRICGVLQTERHGK